MAGYMTGLVFGHNSLKVHPAKHRLGLFLEMLRCFLYKTLLLAFFRRIGIATMTVPKNFHSEV